MKAIIFGLGLAAAAGCGVYFMPLNAFADAPGYPLSTRDAMSRLAAADLRRGKEPFGTLDMLVTKPRNNVLEYSGTGSFAQIKCRVELTPEGEQLVTAATSCERAAPVDGAAASAASEITELAFAEFVDAALDGRQFDESKFQMKSAASVLHNLPQMQKDAIRMSREAAEMQSEWDKAEDSPAQYGSAEEGGWGSDSSPSGDGSSDW